MVVGEELEEFNKKLENFLRCISENKLKDNLLDNKDKSITSHITMAIKQRISASEKSHTEPTSYMQAIKQLEDIYLYTNYRHAYSTITKYVVSQK